jgi:hypothetical protein
MQNSYYIYTITDNIESGAKNSDGDCLQIQYSQGYHILKLKNEDTVV